MDESFVETHLDPDHELPSPTASQMTQEKPRHSFVLLGALIAVVILVAMGVAYVIGMNAGKQVAVQAPSVEPVAVLPSPVVVATPTPVDPTASWRTLSRTYWSFKVPHNWHYWACDNSSTSIFAGPTIIADTTEICAFDGAPGAIGISTFENTELPVLEDTDPNDSFTVSERSALKVDGQDAILQKEVETEGQGQGERYTVYIPSKRTSIVLTSTDLRTTFDQILSTFTFTPSLSPGKNGVQTYMGKEFSFQYSSDWVLYGGILTSEKNESQVSFFENDGMSNECMVKTSTQSQNGFFVKNYQADVTSGAMCEGGDPTRRQKWVVKNPDSYGPGVIISYTTKTPITLVNQILSTFKFTN